MAEKKEFYKLVDFPGGPKNGGRYSGSVISAAKKAANRWVLKKDVYNDKKTFAMEKISRRAEEKERYKFEAYREKLAKPLKFVQGGVERVVNCKVIVKKI